MSSILGDIYRRNNQYAVTDKCTLANMLAILTDIGDGGEDVHTYIAINEADLAPKKVCFEGDVTLHFLKQEPKCLHYLDWLP